MHGLRPRAQRRPPRYTTTAVAATVTYAVTAPVTTAVTTVVTAAVAAAATAMFANSTASRTRSLQTASSSIWRLLPAVRCRHVLMPVRRDDELCVCLFP